MTVRLFPARRGHDMNFLVVSIDQPNMVHLGDHLRALLVRLLLSLWGAHGRLTETFEDQFVRRNLDVERFLGYFRPVRDFLMGLFARRGHHLVGMRRD